jgi:hypothetical protein
MKKQEILDEIKRTAAANGGKPPGSRTFATETGIQESEWLGKHWARWGDAVHEAGLVPNQRTADSTRSEKATPPGAESTSLQYNCPRRPKRSMSSEPMIRAVSKLTGTSGLKQNGKTANGSRWMPRKFRPSNADNLCNTLEPVPSS